MVPQGLRMLRNVVSRENISPAIEISSSQSAGLLVMPILTRALGDSLRSEKVISQFKDYDNAYNDPTVLAVLESEIKTLILK